MLEGVEEYRYLASPGELRPLHVNVVALRVAAFRKVYKKLNQPGPGNKSPSLTKRRLR